MKATGKNNNEHKRGFWTRIGSAWEHKDKQGFDIVLDALPVDSRLTLRVPLEKVDEE